MKSKKNNTRSFITKPSNIGSSLKRVGVQDGAAGNYIAPHYIAKPFNNYTPGTKQYFEGVARRLNKSIVIYQQELDNSHG